MGMKTINDLTVNGHMAQDYFIEKLGYTRAKFDWVRVRPDEEVIFCFDLMDDFQEKLPDSMKYKVSWITNIDGADLWEKLRAWPNREQRELTVMARKAAAIDADLDKITSAQVRAFVEALRPKIEELRRQIGHDPNVEIT